MKLKVLRKKRWEEGGGKRRENWGFWKSSGNTKFDSSISPSGLGSGPLKVHMLFMAFYIPFSVLLSSIALTTMGFNVKR
jgi:hypothetical protein